MMKLLWCTHWKLARHSREMLDATFPKMANGNSQRLGTFQQYSQICFIFVSKRTTNYWYRYLNAPKNVLSLVPTWNGSPILSIAAENFRGPPRGNVTWHLARMSLFFRSNLQCVSQVRPTRATRATWLDGRHKSPLQNYNSPLHFTKLQWIFRWIILSNVCFTGSKAIFE